MKIIEKITMKMKAVYVSLYKEVLIGEHNQKPLLVTPQVITQVHSYDIQLVITLLLSFALDWRVITSSNLTMTISI